MIRTDPRVDAYIERAAAFAQPLLRRIRAAVHAAAPGVAETIKWGMPHFTVDGRILCHMAAFKAHCALGFHTPEVLGIGAPASTAMGQFGRIASAADLPDDAALRALVERAVQARAVDAPPRPRRPSKPAVEEPAEFRAALDRSAGTRAAFERLAPGQRREYVEWIVEAKRADTRARRIAQAIEWIAEGKPRNWKYQPPTHRQRGDDPSRS